jgi:hypothetical protein
MKNSVVNYLILIYLGFLFVSCSESRKPISAEDAEKMFASGVVLIVNRYMYSLELENGITFYFTSFNEEGELDLGVDSGKISPAICSGTGFFITADGQIATNSHVAFPAIEEKRVLAYIHKQGKAIKLVCNEYLRNNENFITDSERQQLQMIIDNVDYLSHADGIVTLHTDIGVAYNNTFLDSFSELYPCVGIKNDESCDLAIIQLKSKQTPNDRYVFDPELPLTVEGKMMPDKNGKPIEIDEIAIGTPLYMIGFNSSLSIGNTKEGIKAQLTQGTVSQLVDDLEFMYTIPSLQGSSGSPVLNEYGDLVAINHAGWTRTQSFNYGIRVKHLRTLIHQRAN